MREFIDVTAEMAAHSKALDAIAKAIAQGDQVVSIYFLNTKLSLNITYKGDAHERYERGLQTGLDEYAGKTKRQKYAKDERYRDFHSSIWVSAVPQLCALRFSFRIAGGQTST
jgi:hypothetical protein